MSNQGKHQIHDMECVLYHHFRPNNQVPVNGGSGKKLIPIGLATEIADTFLIMWLDGGHPIDVKMCKSDKLVVSDSQGILVSSKTFSSPPSWLLPSSHTAPVQNINVLIQEMAQIQLGIWNLMYSSPKWTFWP